MKTQKRSLVFAKSAILELQNEELLTVNGGSTVAGGPSCTGCVCFEVEKNLIQINNNAAM